MPGRTVFGKLWSMCYLSAGGAVAYGGICFYSNNEKFYNNFLMPLTHKLDPETSHKLAIQGLKYKLFPSYKHADDSVLKTKLFKTELSNPIGIGAGFDKHGEAISGLSNIGFGFIEIGTITPNPQPGNDKPRVFRLSEDKAVINRYGFNSDGHSKVLERINQIDPNDRSKYVLGVNLGKNKETDDAINDYILGIEKFADKADYLVINISSPNTPGLRNLQNKDHLYKLLSAVIKCKNTLKGENSPMIFLKLAPDLSQEERIDIAKILNKKECKVDGLIVSNTTIQRNNLSDSTHGQELGGLSGQPLRDMSTDLIRDMYKLSKGQIPIIGVGGVFNGQDAFEKILAGASAIQIYTSFIYNGPPIVKKIKSELTSLLIENGYQNVNDAVGKENNKK